MPSLPNVHVTTDAITDLAVDVLIVPVFRGAIEGPGTDTALRALGLSEVPRDASFRGKPGEVLHLAAPGQPWGRVTLVGLGRLDELDTAMVRRAMGAAIRSVASTAATVASTLPLVETSVASIQAATEGALLGAYRYDDARSAPGPAPLTDVTLIVPSSLSEAATAAIGRAELHARAQCVARDLVAMPPNRLGPEEVAAYVVDHLGDDIEVEVWDEDRLRAERCGGLLSVADGSARPPRLVRLRYRPAEPVASVSLVGKGITFDSGGISLKRPSSNMDAMKGDMGGVAAIIGVFSVLQALDIPVEVQGELCLAENMPGGNATRPSDVVTYRDGTTVEVLNTDAEGRLVLADGLLLAAEADVDAIVDVATLTGAVSAAIGRHAVGVFANDDDLLRQLLAAGEDAGEPSWHLPLWEELSEGLESDVADLRNIGDKDRGAGASVGGLFLRHFVDGTPWAHLDIAGPSWRQSERDHLSKQGTGVPVRTLLRWLEQAG
ncbi:MAG: leucyl aminopeptidase [Actinomycetota bacterium]